MEGPTDIKNKELPSHNRLGVPKGTSSPVEHRIDIAAVAGSTPASPTTRIMRGTRPIPPLDEWSEYRFWEKVRILGPDDCWPWDSAGAHSDRGRFKIQGRLYSPPRVAYALTKGKIPAGSGYHGCVVRHTCDNPPCCNPRHLEAGSHQDNVDDMVKRGRAQRWRRGITPVMDAIPDDIKGAIRCCGLSRRHTAAKFGVSEWSVRRIVGTLT
jgi:hypothetical protein